MRQECETYANILQAYSVKNVLLAEHCRKLVKVTSTQHPLPEHLATTLIAKKMAENVTGSNGSNTIQKPVAIVNGIRLSWTVSSFLFWFLCGSQSNLFTEVPSFVPQ